MIRFTGKNGSYSWFVGSEPLSRWGIGGLFGLGLLLLMAEGFSLWRLAYPTIEKPVQQAVHQTGGAALANGAHAVDTYHLFGKLPGESDLSMTAEPPPPSLKLLGVFLASGQTPSRVVIYNDDTHQAESYAVGDEVFQGLTVQSIEAQRVLLSGARGGSALVLPEIGKNHVESSFDED